MFDAEEFYIQSGEVLSFNAHKYILSSIQARDNASQQQRYSLVKITAMTAAISLFSFSTISLNIAANNTLPVSVNGATSSNLQ